jgi:hypothetical protein
VWFLSEFLLRIGTAFFSEAQWHDFVSRYPKILQSVLLSRRKVYIGIGQRARDYLISYLIVNSDTRPSLLKRVERLLEEGFLSAQQESALRGLSISIMKAAQLKLSTSYEAIISALKSHNWYTQNPAADLVQMNASEIASLAPQKQQELGRNMLQAADGGAGSAISYFSQIKNRNIELPIDFVRGVAFECFVNEHQEFRLKERGLAISVDIFKQYSDVIADLVQQIASATPRGWISSTSYEGVLALVRERTQLTPLFEALTQNRARLVTFPADT